MRVRPVVAPLVLLLVLAACGRASRAVTSGDGYPMAARFSSDTGEAVLRVRIARTEDEREQGLMHVDSLPEDAGMAFVWDDPTDASFWMKDTLIPLSIAFVDASGRVESIREMRPCSSDPCPLYTSDGPFVVAVEANAGWFDRHGIAVGDRFGLETA
jgi:uncharacterized membrane protein (UPF0127 family)